MRLGILGMNATDLPPSNWSYSELKDVTEEVDAYLMTWREFLWFHWQYKTQKPVILISRHWHDLIDQSVEAVLDDPIVESEFLALLERLERASDSLLIQTRSWQQRLHIPNISYIESVGRKLELHTKKQVLRFNGSLKELQKRLGERFVKPHRSYLVNRQAIVSISSNSLELNTGVELPLAPARRSVIHEAWKNYI